MIPYKNAKEILYSCAYNETCGKKENKKKEEDLLFQESKN
jgi:hypothetical protein